MCTDGTDRQFYYRARYYNPVLGRFISRDPLSAAEFKEGSNLYAYVRNNSINSFDPNGLWQVTIQGGAGFGGQLTFGKNSGQWNGGVKLGSGDGLSGSIDLNDSGCQESGFSGEAGFNVDGGFGGRANAGVNFSDQYGGKVELGASVGKAVGIGGSYSNEGGFTPSAGFGGGESVFMGGGVNYHF